VAPTQQANIHFSVESGVRIMNSFIHKRIISAVKRVEFVSDRMLYIILRGCCCDITVLNVHVPTEDKIDDIKDNFYEELKLVFDKFSKYHLKK
jgi:hypothetical protein